MSKNSFTFNFNAPVGQNIANVEHMEVHMDKDGNIQVMNAGQVSTEQKHPESTPDPVPASAKQRGPKVQYLFADVNRNEDTERTSQEAEHVKRYIADHHMGNKHLDCTNTNQLNLLVACFYYEWRERGWVSAQPQGAAIHRFLTEQCSLPCDVEPKAYARAIANLIKGNHKDYNIIYNLRSYFE